MKITAYYNKNLKMSEGRLASQVCDVSYNLGEEEGFTLGLEEIRSSNKWFCIQEDLEVGNRVVTVFRYIE